MSNQIEQVHVLEGEHECRHFENEWKWSYRLAKRGDSVVLVFVCSECGDNCGAVPFEVLSGNSENIPNLKDIKPQMIREGETSFSNA